LHNPFYFRELPLESPFCDRETELNELVSHAKNKANVVIFSPRRYGKTSLVKRVQENLRNHGTITVYVDFFGVDSVEDLSRRLASRIYAYCRDNESMLKKLMRILSSWRPVFRPEPEYGISLTVETATNKRGLELLNDSLSELGNFINSSKEGFHIVFDEFQEIVELRESLQIEGTMRSHIQTHRNASYFFVGSRRRILNEIFNERKRPFYRSAINFPLNPLPIDAALSFIIEQFKNGGKTCPYEIAKKIAERVKGYPYYVQRVSYSVFEVSSRKITEEDYIKGFRKVVDEERLVYEAMLQALSPQQIKLFSSLAEEPTDKPFSSGYMASHGLGSVGGVQGAIKKLLDLDYIEKQNNIFQVVDPVFGVWIKSLKR
jgi:hypothetical protein